MNVKRAPITTLCVLLSLVFCSLVLQEQAWLLELVPREVARMLPPILAVGSLLLASVFFFLFERFHGTHLLCPERDIASLPLWADLQSRQVGGVDGSRIRLMTINMLLRPPFINYNGDDFKNERLDLLIRHVLPHYDIVALQEVFWFWNFRLSKLLKEAKALGFHWYTNNAPPPMSSRKFIDGGLVILSRYPITETRKRIYARGVQIDGWAAKQALHAKVQISPTTHIHVITTHTQADYASNSTNSENATARMTQIREIGELIREIWRDDPRKGEVVVMGDLNVDGRAHDEDDGMRLSRREKWGAWGEEDRDSDEYREMMATFRRSARGKLAASIGGPLSRVYNQNNIAHRHRHHDNNHDQEGCKAKECGPDAAPEPRILCTDLLRAANKGINPVTIGDVRVLDDGRLAPRETALTDPVTDIMSRSCLDYMIHFRHNAGTRGGEALEVVESQVEPFYFDPRKLGGLPVTQLSDHYGLSSTIALKTSTTDNT